jgi:serine/threonine protein kinase
MLDQTLLSRYQIHQLLGSGGFGDTYLARDLALPGHPNCVVKHLCPKDPNPAILAVAHTLFEREATVLYQLGEKAAIPRLYAHFCHEDKFFLVEEFIPGHDLAEELQPGVPWSEADTQALLRDILTVLLPLHRERIIHRDLKPHNIRRRPDGSLVLIDFGAVKEIHQLAINEGGSTSVSVVVGSPGYMPAEQLIGKPKLASDIFAVGMIGLQALTGQFPGDLPEDPETGLLQWRESASVSDRFGLFLDRMIHPYYLQRYSSAIEAFAPLEGEILGMSDRPQQTFTQPSAFPATDLTAPWAKTVSPLLSHPAERKPQLLWQRRSVRWGSVFLGGSLLAVVGVMLAQGVGWIAPIPGLTPGGTLENNARSPEAFVRDYYQEINQRHYEQTWQRLSPAQQQRGGGWPEYLKWWSSVDAVYFETLTVTEQTPSTATITMKLWYVMRDQSVTPERKNQIHLIRPRPEEPWLIDRVSAPS